MSPYREPADRSDEPPAPRPDWVLVVLALLAVPALGILIGSLSLEQSITPLVASVAVLVGVGSLAFDRRR